MEITNKRQCSQQALGCNVSTAGDPKSRERRAIGQGGTAVTLGSPRCEKYKGVEATEMVI